MNEAAVVVSDPKKVKEKNSKMVDQDLSPSSEDGDVASKLSDLSESSTDNGLQRHDDMMMMDHTTSSNNNKNSKSNKNKHKLRSERSEDYENFEKMLRNKHSKACKAMSVRRAMSVYKDIVRCVYDEHNILTLCRLTFPYSTFDSFLGGCVPQGTDGL